MVRITPNNKVSIVFNKRIHPEFFINTKLKKTIIDDPYVKISRRFSWQFTSPPL